MILKLCGVNQVVLVGALGDPQGLEPLRGGSKAKIINKKYLNTLLECLLYKGIDLLTVGGGSLTPNDHCMVAVIKITRKRLGGNVIEVRYIAQILQGHGSEEMNIRIDGIVIFEDGLVKKNQDLSAYSLNMALPLVMKQTIGDIGENAQLFDLFCPLMANTSVLVTVVNGDNIEMI